MPTKYRPGEIAQTPAQDRDRVITELLQSTAEVVGGLRGVSELVRLAIRDRNSGMLERSVFLSTAVLSQIQAWTTGQRLYRPFVYLGLKSGYLRESEAYALVARAAASIDLDKPVAAEGDLLRYFGLSLPAAVSEKLTPQAQELLALARLRQRQWEAAEGAAHTAVKSARQRADRRGLARSLLLLSEALLRSGRVPESIKAVSEASDLAMVIDDLGLSGDVYHVRVKIAATQGHLQDAIKYADLATQAYMKIEAPASVAAIDLLRREIERSSEA
jgi:tetratricopeptide (TPR) repeat protein